MIRSPHVNITFFEITTGFLQEDTTVPFLFIICLDYVHTKYIDCNSELDLTITERNITI